MNLTKSPNRNWLQTIAIRILFAAGIACLLLMLPTAALAGSTQTYNVTGTLADGDTVSGTFTIDFSTDAVTTGPGGITVNGTTFTCPGAGGCLLTNSFPGTDAIAFYDSSTVDLVLDWNVLAGTIPPSSITVNTGDSYCTDCGGATTRSFFSSATVTAVQTPEPSEILMLLAGLGALGALIVFRRKLAANA